MGTEDSKSFEIAVASPAEDDIHWGFHILLEGQLSDDKCEKAWPTLKVTSPSGQALQKGTSAIFTSSLDNHCSDPPEKWMTDNSPPLQQLAYFHPPRDANGIIIEGTYTGECDFGVWVVDSGKEIGEAVSGLFAALTLWLIAMALLCVGSILLCVSCCCCCGCCGGQSSSSGGGVTAGTVIGQPVSSPNSPGK